MTSGLRLAVVVALAAAGCGAGISPSGTIQGSTAASSPTAPASPAPTLSLAPTASPAVSATPAPPPQAEIVSADATIPGGLGTYVIDDRGSDSPALPFDTLPAVNVGARDTLTIRFVDGVAIGDFQVVLTAAADTAGASPREVPATLSADGLLLTVGPLPAGRWVLDARLFRADGRGDGLTFWAVTVT